jgi:hypothetical protein
MNERFLDIDSDKPKEEKSNKNQSAISKHPVKPNKDQSKPQNVLKGGERRLRRRGK